MDAQSIVDDMSSEIKETNQLVKDITKDNIGIKSQSIEEGLQKILSLVEKISSLSEEEENADELKRLSTTLEKNLGEIEAIQKFLESKREMFEDEEENDEKS